MRQTRSLSPFGHKCQAEAPIDKSARDRSTNPGSYAAATHPYGGSADDPTSRCRQDRKVVDAKRSWMEVASLTQRQYWTGPNRGARPWHTHPQLNSQSWQDTSDAVGQIEGAGQL